MYSVRISWYSVLTPLGTPCSSLLELRAHPSCVLTVFSTINPLLGTLNSPSPISYVLLPLYRRGAAGDERANWYYSFSLLLRPISSKPPYLF